MLELDKSSLWELSSKPSVPEAVAQVAAACWADDAAARPEMPLVAERIAALLASIGGAAPATTSTWKRTRPEEGEAQRAQA